MAATLALFFTAFLLIPYFISKYAAVSRYHGLLAVFNEYRDKHFRGRGSRQLRSKISTSSVVLQGLVSGPFKGCQDTAPNDYPSACWEQESTGHHKGDPKQL